MAMRVILSMFLFELRLDFTMKFYVRVLIVFSLNGKSSHPIHICTKYMRTNKTECKRSHKLFRVRVDLFNQLQYGTAEWDYNNPYLCINDYSTRSFFISFVVLQRLFNVLCSCSLEILQKSKDMKRKLFNACCENRTTYFIGKQI